MDCGGQKTLQFIDDYRNNVILWQASHKLYTDREARKDAIRKLSEKYNVTPQAILNKIKSLRSYFHREHGRVLRRGYNSNWFAYKPLMFVLEGNEGKSRKDASNNEDDIKEEVDDTVITIESESFDNEYVFVEPALPQKKKRRLSSEEVQEQDFEYEEIDEVQTSPKKGCHKFENEDHLSIFGKYVESRLRGLNNPRLQSIGQHRINNVLFDLEMNSGEKSSEY